MIKIIRWKERDAMTLTEALHEYLKTIEQQGATDCGDIVGRDECFGFGTTVLLAIEFCGKEAEDLAASVAEQRDLARAELADARAEIERSRDLIRRL